MQIYKNVSVASRYKKFLLELSRVVTKLEIRVMLERLKTVGEIREKLRNFLKFFEKMEN